MQRMSRDWKPRAGTEYEYTDKVSSDDVVIQSGVHPTHLDSSNSGVASSRMLSYRHVELETLAFVIVVKTLSALSASTTDTTIHVFV